MGPPLQHASVILHLSLRLHYARDHWPGVIFVAIIGHHTAITTTTASLSRFNAMVLPSFSTALYTAPGSLSPTSPPVPTSNPPVQTAASGQKTPACFCRSEAVKKCEAKRVCLCSTSRTMRPWKPYEVESKLGDSDEGN
ncbi:hypothetical protein FF1_017498 [Malus domestica]|uniref:uncharacterized protein LOC126603234 n=1 Tax=Malus sylvestris TaxID=3752 RepID=UPI0010AA8335|nr:uncharacterized protein LOC103423319 [Malus domestica]XP_050125971.1 uncharacterized protein LOC126603234 [Malus sylvestris]